MVEDSQYFVTITNEPSWKIIDLITTMPSSNATHSSRGGVEPTPCVHTALPVPRHSWAHSARPLANRRWEHTASSEGPATAVAALRGKREGGETAVLW